MSARLISAPETRLETRSAKAGALENMARRIVFSRLEKLDEGQITVREQGSLVSFGKLSEEFPMTAEIVVQKPQFYSDIAFGGSIGAGESYMHGCWTCDDLTTLLRIVIRNRDVLEMIDSGLSLLSKPLQKCFHALKRNTRGGSRRNIAAHYDLGNDFYRLWLDSKMMYSCAWFESPGASLEHASTAKLERICRKLDLRESDSVLEIGTGWGGMAIHAARHYGCHVTTTTISRQQYDHARQAIRDAGLEDKITLLFKDYRDLEGRYDKLISIEMIEAVGHEYHEVFFRKCQELLKPDGQMLLQTITIADQRYEQYKNDVDFIKRYIFPGGCLTSVTDMARVMTKHTDMRMVHLEDIGLHYAATLRHWHRRFNASIDDVKALCYSDEFIRMWRFYFCYCESAFLERVIGDAQILFARAASQRNQHGAELVL
ncbi:MAG: cyclopropane-fatty-acyl-phospholipid synthase family protein [Woeseiaceae bacterium]|nr:cyclopropane-fatty-acyl-phospholipid synthase family protein [Woeseiaceae bacterium]